jgi:hypothetical protein
MPYGYYMTGRLFYDIDNIDSDYACKPIKTITVDHDIGSDKFPIVMVDRSNCTFVTKARNVQNIGGRIALIVNNNNEDINNIIMADDGTGNDINIQAVLISLEDGEKIKQFIRENKHDTAMLAKLILAIEYEMVRIINSAKIGYCRV